MAKNVSTSGLRRRSPGCIELIPVPGLPEIREGNDLAGLIFAAARKARIVFEDADIVVVAQKVVSKAEGRIARLSTVEPSGGAMQLAAKGGRDPRLVEVILRESGRIVREHPVLIVETHHGFVCANAGVDHSNVPGDDVVTLLPKDPDRSARVLAEALRRLSQKRVAVVISDTFGRPWRLGLTNVAVGAAGIPVLLDLRGSRDRNSKPLQATILAIADDLAAAAGLVMGKREGLPAVIIRGYKYRPAQEPATKIIRPAGEDLFR
ncbi:MAG: F420-0:gamma-glutamyl ligase [Candidatus Acidoferrum typicum]|nr:F420-0:gamma-glutamyl ligase [Candidatus Acidoferrum typicum]